EPNRAPANQGETFMTHVLATSLLLSRFVLPVALNMPVPADPAQTEKDGFTPLFDGKTLDGWEGNLDYWKVKESMIVGDSPGIRRNEFLCTKQQFGDFELRVTFRILGDETKNSGIQFRSKRVPDDTEVSGYQADIGQEYWGCLYDESRRKKVLVQAPKEPLE